MIENPEIQAKILEWQRRYNIPDGDPAMALLELLDIYGYRGGAIVAAPRVTAPAPEGEPVPIPASAPVSFAGVDEAVAEQIRSQLFPAIERLGFQTQELKQKLEAMGLENFAQQVATYHEGIDYCTKKLDVVKKESDALVVQIAKVASSINPVTRLAVGVLMVVSAVIGYVVAVAMN